MPPTTDAGRSKPAQSSGLWVDKYRPNQLSKVDFHCEQAAQLQQLVSSGDFPHLLVYGPSGAGKKTRVRCVLRELYGAGADRLRIEHKQFTAPSGKRLELATVASNYHIEINPSDVGVFDRVVVQEVIKTMAQTQQLDMSTQKEFKTVVLTEVDRLTRDAQQALRRTMEKYMSTCRLMLVTQSISKVIEPLRSRCLPVRVSAPSQDEICAILTEATRKEGGELPAKLAQRIAVKSKGNLRRALLMCETCHVNKAPQPSGPDDVILEPDWEIYTNETAEMIIKSQTPEQLLKVRERFYELLTRCIPPSVIFKQLVLSLGGQCDAPLQPRLIALAAEFEHSMQRGSKAIYHLEAFVAGFTAEYKAHADSMAEFMH